MLEGVYPRAPDEPSPRDQLLRLAGQPTFPTFPNATKRMKLSREALDTMPEKNVRLAIQLYHVIHELRDGDFQLFKTTRNRLQHPRPSVFVAKASLAALVESLEIPFNLDTGTADELIEEESKKDSGDPESSLFGKADDPRMLELFNYLQ